MGRRKLGTFFFLFACLLCIVAYQNCSPMKAASSQSSTPSSTSSPGFGAGGASEGKTHFDTKVLPMIAANCTACHSEPRFGGTGPLTVMSYSAMLVKLGNGSSAVNNELINKMQNLVTHSGGNRCTAGITATPCKEISDWYQKEFKASANGYLGGISTITFDGTVQGWALDTANPAAKVNVVFYINNSSVGVGTSVGSQMANLDGVVPVSSPAYQHSFSFRLPATYTNGSTNTVFVYVNTATPGNALPSGSKTFAAFSPTVAGMNYYNNTVKPALTICSNCHFVDYAEQYRALAFPSPRDGGTATNNALIQRPGGVVGHGGGNICGGINGTPCNLFQQWWALEFGP